jgi:hypothetical protein
MIEFILRCSCVCVGSLQATCVRLFQGSRQKHLGGRFKPAWIDAEGDEVYKTVNESKKAKVELYWAEGLGLNDIIAIVPRRARRAAREKGVVPNALGKQGGQKVK